MSEIRQLSRLSLLRFIGAGSVVAIGSYVGLSRLLSGAPAGTDAEQNPVGLSGGGSVPMAPQRVAVRLEVIERAAWGADPPAGSFTEHTIKRVTVHHSAGLMTDNREAVNRVRAYQRYHLDSGFVDIAYHFAIDRNGNVFEGRALGLAGETFTDYDPVGHFQPMCIGNFEEQDITDAQLNTLVDLIAWGISNFGLSLESIAGHADYAATACPGSALYSRLTNGSVQELVTERLMQGAPELHYLRGSAAIERVDRVRAGSA